MKRKNRERGEDNAMKCQTDFAHGGGDYEANKPTSVFDKNIYSTMSFIPSSLTGNTTRLDEHDGAVVGAEGGAEAAGEAPRQDGAAEQAARPSGKLTWITDPLH